MKKLIVLLTVVAVMLTCTTAFAADTVYEHIGGKYTVTYNGTADEMYGFVVVGPTTVGEGEDAVTDYYANFTSSSILYIDQQTANSAGKVEFKNFMLRDTATEDADGYYGKVFIGGGEASALALGYCGGEKVITGVNVAGTITDTNNPREATVTLKDAEGTTVGTANTVSGAYSIAEVMPGTYSLEIAKTASCILTYSNVVVGETDDVTVNATTTKYAGDVDTTNEINGYDLRTVITDFNKVSGTHTFANPNADADASGTVNGYDLRVIIANFNQKGETKSL